MVVKLCAGPQRGGSASSAIKYVLNYAGGPKVYDSPEEQRAVYHSLLQEALSRPDQGVGIIWEPKAGKQTGRPDAVFCEGVSSFSTCAIEMDISAVTSREWLLKDNGILHIVTSWGHDESKFLSSENAINMTRHMLNHDEVGLRGFKTQIVVHRDTCKYENGELIDGNVHCHTVVMVASDPKTNLPWNRNRDMYRLSHGCRSAELSFSTPDGQHMKHDHGLMTVRYDEHGVARIEPATKAELQSWRRTRALHTIEDSIRNRIDEYYEYRTKNPSAWANEIVAPKILQYLERSQSENEQPSWAIIHHLAGQEGAVLGYDRERQQLTVRLILKDEEGGGVAEEPAAHWHGSERVDEHGDPLPERKEMRLGPEVMLQTKNVIGAEPPSSAKQSEKEAWYEREKFVPTYENLEVAEQRFISRNESDIGWASRSLVEHEGRAIFDISDVTSFLAQGMTSADEITSLGQYILDHDSSLVPLTGEEHEARPLRTPFLQYTTQQQMTLERETRNVLEALAKQRPVFDRAMLVRAIDEIETEKHIKFDDEDRRILESMSGAAFSWTGSDPGTGKTTLTSAVVRYAELTRTNVIGVTPTSRSAEEMELRSGAFARNTTLALTDPKIAGEMIRRGTIIQFDETSLLPMRHLKSIATIALERGAIIKGYGDAAQLGPVQSAGDAHGLACTVAQKYGSFTEGHSVKRQQGDLVWMQSLVPRFGLAIRQENQEEIARCIYEMDAHNVIQFHQTREQTLIAVAKECVAAIRRGELYVACTKNSKDVQQLNKTIRESLGITGGIPFWTPKHGSIDLVEGDRILFTRNENKRIRVYNGYTGRITKIEYHPEREKLSRNGIGVYTVHVALDNGRSVAFDPRAFPHIRYGYARTVHTSQSISITTDIVATVHKQDARSAFVATTRGVNALQWHVAETVYPVDPEKKSMTKIQAFAAGIAQRTEGQSSALLWERQEARYGGPDSHWALTCRRAARTVSDPLFQQYIKSEHDKAEQRQSEYAKINARTTEKMQAAKTDEERAKIEFAHVKAYERVLKKIPEQSFLDFASSPARAKAIATEGARVATAEKIRHERTQAHERRRQPTRGERLAREMESQARMREQQRGKEQEHDRGMSFGR